MSARRLGDLILLRTPSNPFQNDSYHSSSLSHNLTPHHIPVLSTSHINLSTLQLITREGLETRYSGVIVTSARAVDAWPASKLRQVSPDRSEDENKPPWATTIPFFTVGKATRDAVINRSGLQLDSNHVLGAEETGNGDKLASFIVEFFKSMGRTPELPLLYLVGDKNRETIQDSLKENGIKVERLQVYETAMAHDFEERLDAVLEGLDVSNAVGEDQQSLSVDYGCQRIVWLALFSPSGAKLCLQALRKRQLLPPRKRDQDEADNGEFAHGSGLVIRLAAIGPTTRAFLEQEEGLETHAIASSPDADELLRSIRDASA